MPSKPYVLGLLNDLQLIVHAEPLSQRKRGIRNNEQNLATVAHSIIVILFSNDM